MHVNVYCSTIYNSQDTETTYRSLNRRTDKEDVWAVKKKLFMKQK